MGCSSLLAVGFVMQAVGILFVLCAVALVLVVLVQKGRGGGLSAAFGGGIASGLLGSKTGDFLTWVTIVVVGLFLLLALVMAKYYKPGPSDYGEGVVAPPPVRQEQRQPERPGPSAPRDELGTMTGEPDEGSDTNVVGVE